MSINNVTLFNQLTHSQDGLVDEKLFEELLVNFKDFILIRNVLYKTSFVNYTIDKSTMNESGNIYLNLDFKTKDDADKMFEFINKNNYIMYTGSKFFINIQKDEECRLSLYFTQ